MKKNSIYRILLVTNNLISFFFLLLVVLGSYSVSPEAAHPLGEKKILIRQLLYGITIGLFFSLISLSVGIIFKKRLSLDKINLQRLFIIQFLFLAIVYVFIILFIYKISN